MEVVTTISCPTSQLTSSCKNTKSSPGETVRLSLVHVGKNSFPWISMVPLAVIIPFEVFWESPDTSESSLEPWNTNFISLNSRHVGDPMSNSPSFSISRTWNSIGVSSTKTNGKGKESFYFIIKQKKKGTPLPKIKAEEWGIWTL